MRLWHKELITVLPRQQLTGQWRECCMIAKLICRDGTPHHILVNKIMDYSLEHFWNYGILVGEEMQKRDYRCHFDLFDSWFREDYSFVKLENLFIGWHDERYLTQCYYNLQEKYDCGGITDDEWALIYERYSKRR